MRLHSFPTRRSSDPAYLTIVQSISTNLPACDDGTHHYCERADEIGFDPRDHLILVLNDEPQSVNPPHAAITPYGMVVIRPQAARAQVSLGMIRSLNCRL